MERLKPHFKIVIDLETSGSCPIKNGVISACVLIINEFDVVVDEMVWYICPPDHTRYNWSEEAQGIHGMTFEQVSGFIPNDQFCYELLCFLGKYKQYGPLELICHASPNGWFDGKEWKIVKWFDYMFLEWCFRKAKFSNGSEMVWTMYKVLCPLKLISTVKMGRDAGYKGNKLNQWAERLNLNLDHHEVRSDTYVCFETYKYLKARNGTIKTDNKTGKKVSVGTLI